ncbi:hypothetical protein B0H34DRAFT_677817 [Crassisporium funariophilum]|nr:hypothetical protein B0H34DRAFT_677817 [Crassisporium funariophilum]
MSDKEGTPAPAARNRKSKKAGRPQATGNSRGRPSKSTKLAASQASKENHAPAVSRPTVSSAQNPAVAVVPAPLAPNHPVNGFEDKDAEIIRLRALLAEKEKTVYTPEVSAIPRPKGEAGDKKKGFALQEAMDLCGSTEQDALYGSILCTTCQNVIRANLDITVRYRQQDPEKLLQVFKLTRGEHPYLTKKRFPADWAVAEIVKQYLCNQRKEAKRKLKNAHGRARKQARRHIDNLGTGDDEPPNGSGSESDSD